MLMHLFENHDDPSPEEIMRQLGVTKGDYCVIPELTNNDPDAYRKAWASPNTGVCLWWDGHDIHNLDIAEGLFGIYSRGESWNWDSFNAMFKLGEIRVNVYGDYYVFHHSNIRYIRSMLSDLEDDLIVQKARIKIETRASETDGRYYEFELEQPDHVEAFEDFVRRGVYRKLNYMYENARVPTELNKRTQRDN